MDQSLNELNSVFQDLLETLKKTDKTFETEVLKSILEATLETMRGKLFRDGYEFIDTNYGRKLATALMNMMGFGIVNAAYSAVAMYHNNISETLQNLSFDLHGIKGEIHGVEEAVKVIRKSVSDLEKKQIIESVT